MSDNISRSIAEISSRIAGEMDAHLIESIVSLFNRGVLVHYVKSARTTFNPDNCQMTVDSASDVKFEGRERIIELEQQLKQRDELIREAAELMLIRDQGVAPQHMYELDDNDINEEMRLFYTSGRIQAIINKEEK